MRPMPRLAAILLMTVAACGQVEPVLMAVSMPDCVYRGTNRMKEGVVSVSLTLNGITGARAVLVELSGRHTYGELAADVEMNGEMPVWADPVLALELSSAQGLDGVKKTRRLPEGSYALLCVDDAGVRPAGPMTVRG